MHLLNFKISRQFTVAFIFAVFIWLGGTHSTHAQVGIPSNVELNGYAWSSTIGWVSMNCKTGGVTGGDICGSGSGQSDYQVKLNASTGALSGYAWSSNIGWIKFDGLLSWPTTGGTVGASARVTGTYPSLAFEGWARACAGTLSGNCSSMTSRTDGWDGWISLKGTGYNIKTSGTVTDPGSFAWGDTVVGWLGFDDMTLLVPSASISASNCTIAVGASTCDSLVTWNITGAISPNVCNITTTNCVVGVSPYYTTSSGTNKPVAITYGDNYIKARDGSSILDYVKVKGTCAGNWNSASSICEAAAAVATAPVITIVTSREIVRMKSTVVVNWTISRPLVAGETCTVSGQGVSSNKIISGSLISQPLLSKTKFTISCTGAFPTVEASDTVEVVPSVQEV